MRVTAGKFKGRTLIDNKFQHIRPTADMVKQAIFNKLAFSIANAKILDLFCGTGALGIEALSRGAREVVFADSDSRSINLTKDNLKKIGADSGYKVIKSSYEKTLALLVGEQFDIIILDPPYQSGVYEDCLKKIANHNLLSPSGIIVCEHDAKDTYDYSPFIVTDEKKYGIKKVTYLQISNDENKKSSST